MSQLHLAARQFHHCFTRLAESETGHSPAISLSRRERECLEWAARGKTSWETGVILGIQPLTVDTYIKNALRKLNASTRTMAVLKAARLGLITV